MWKWDQLSWHPYGWRDKQHYMGIVLQFLVGDIHNNTINFASCLSLILFASLFAKSLEYNWE